MNTLFQNAIKRVPQNVPPVWFMRQAGRYHRHYQHLRAKHSFMDLCKKPELATEVALGPVEDFDFDVAILFSDLLFPLEAMGMGLSYGDGGPKLGWHLNADNIGQLKKCNDALPALQFQKEAMYLTRSRLARDKSLIGFVGGPWTLFTYAAQGKHDGSLIEAKQSMFSLYRDFAALLVPLLIQNIRLQFEGGAEVVMLFDTAAGELSPFLFHEYVVPDLQKLAEAYPGKLGYYSKSTHRSYLLHPFFKSGLLAGLGVDHRWDMSLAFPLSPSGFVQGNFDQALLHLSKDDFRRELDRHLMRFREMSPEARAGWVCALGHGVLPKTPEDNVRHFVKRVRELFA